MQEIGVREDTTVIADLEIGDLMVIRAVLLVPDGTTGLLPHKPKTRFRGYGLMRIGTLEWCGTEKNARANTQQGLDVMQASAGSCSYQSKNYTLKQDRTWSKGTQGQMPL